LTLGFLAVNSPANISASGWTEVDPLSVTAPDNSEAGEVAGCVVVVGAVVAAGVVVMGEVVAGVVGAAVVAGEVVGLVLPQPVRIMLNASTPTSIAISHLLLMSFILFWYPSSNSFFVSSFWIFLIHISRPTLRAI
jgi:hypothetical protein